MNSKKGFTLIELLAVIVIIAIIATIGIFAVAKIMSKSRIDALSNTALSIRRAVNLYATESELSSGEINLDLLGANSDLMDIGKDPWGKDYIIARSVITKDVDNINIVVYLETINGCYVLKNDSTKVESSTECNELGQLIFEVTPDNIQSLITYNPATSGSTLHKIENYIVQDPLGLKGNVIHGNLIDFQYGEILLLNNDMLASNPNDFEGNTVITVVEIYLPNQGYVNPGVDTLCASPGLYKPDLQADLSFDNLNQGGGGCQFFNHGVWEKINTQYPADFITTTEWPNILGNVWFGSYEPAHANPRVSQDFYINRLSIYKK